MALCRTLRLKAKWGAFAAPIGEVRRICSANKKFSQIFFIRCALPISGERIAAPVVLAQHKEHERIDEAQKTICSASPIVIEIA